MGNEIISSSLHDYGDAPVALNIAALVKLNTNFRTAVWTGKHLQITVMCIKTGGEIGVEMHDNLDQILVIESGCGNVMMGECKDALTNCKRINCNYAIVVPAGTWHNVVNTGNVPLKLFSVYAPPQHPFGTIHKTKCDSDNAEH